LEVLEVIISGLVHWFVIAVNGRSVLSPAGTLYFRRYESVKIDRA